MKRIILVMDEDTDYSKKFCNQSNKILGKKYIFLTFSSLKLMNEYASNNKVEAVITQDELYEKVEEIDTNFIYLLNEKEKNLRKEGKITFIYKLQSIKNILETLDKDIEKRYENKKLLNNNSSKLVTFYSPSFIKNKREIIKRISKYIQKKKKCLIVDLDEFDNYKGKVGLSNIIYDYKEGNLSSENLKKEIVTEKEQDYIKSITYPEDYNVITNIDIGNILNEFLNLPYDYIFVNADMSFVRCQYIISDSDIIVLFKDKNNEKNEIFKQYLKNENIVDLKKVNEIDLVKLDKTYLTAFSKQVFEEKNEKRRL